MRLGWIVGLVALCLATRALGDEVGPLAAAETLLWFQSTEQALMDSVAVGDKSRWERVMDLDPKKLRPLIPLTPDAFVVSGSLGEWLFVTEKGRAVRILDFRKFEPLVWTRVDDEPSER